MSLTVALALIAFAAVTLPIFAKERPQAWEVPVGVLVAVMLFARGAEPAQTYVWWAASLLAVLITALAVKSIPRHVLPRMRAELIILSCLVVTLMLSAFVLPGAQAIQVPALVIIVGLTIALIVTGVTRSTVMLFRAVREKKKSA